MLSTLLQAIPAIRTGLKGKDLSQQKRTSAEMGNVANAQYNMDNPLYQRLYEQNRRAGQQDLASTIAEISRQNRKLTSMGRKPLLDQERGGESIFRNLIMGQQDVGNQARQGAFGQLQQGQNALAGLYDAQNLTADQGYDNKLRKVGAYYSIGDVLQNLFGLQGQKSNNPYQTQLGSGETINWRR